MTTSRSWPRIALWSALGIATALRPLSPVHAADGPARTALHDAAQAFDDAALRIDTSPATELARWTGPIYLAIAEHPALELHAATVEAAVRMMAGIARVTVARVNWNDARANFIVRPGTIREPGRSLCRSSIDWMNDGSMVRAEISVNITVPDRVVRCINHEVLHGFGFRGHPHGSFSVLSYRHAHQAQLTRIDRLMLETLYDPRLRPGMKAALASVTACVILAEKLGSGPEEASILCAPRMLAARQQFAAFTAGHGAMPPFLQPGYRDGY